MMKMCLYLLTTNAFQLLVFKQSQKCILSTYWSFVLVDFNIILVNTTKGTEWGSSAEIFFSSI